MNITISPFGIKIVIARKPEPTFETWSQRVDREHERWFAQVERDREEFRKSFKDFMNR
jgi:hypothetical protein